MLTIPVPVAVAAEPPGVARRDPAAGTAGLHLLVGFDLPLSESHLIARAAAVGVGLDGAGACYLDAPPPRPSVLLGYASVPEAGIREGIRALARALAPGRATRSGG